MAQEQRVLPASTVALAIVPVREAARETLSLVLNSDQKIDDLMKRLETLSVDRFGVDVWDAETAVLFWCKGGERGVILLGEFSSRKLKNTDRRIAGLASASLGDDLFLAKVGEVLVVAPGSGLELLGRVERGAQHKLLGTKRLQAFRASRSLLPEGAIRFFAQGSWFLEFISPRTSSAVSKGLNVVFGFAQDGRVALQGLGETDAVRVLAGHVEEAVRIVTLQNEMLRETADDSQELGDRLSRVLVTEMLSGLLSSVSLDTKDDRMQVQLSVPRGLSLAAYSVLEAILNGSHSNLLVLPASLPASK